MTNKRKPAGKKICTENWEETTMMTLTEMIISILREKVDLLRKTEEDGRLLVVYQFLLASYLEAGALPGEISKEHSPDRPEGFQ